MNLVKKQKIYHLEEVKVHTVKEQLELYKSNNWREDYLLGQLNKIKILDKSIDKKEHAKEIIKFFEIKLEKELGEYLNFEKRYEFIDLFSGAGGLSLGLEQAGLFPKIAIDHYATATKTYLFNRPYLNNENVITQDIRDEELIITNKVPLVVGGPPCQGFSNANKQQKKDDNRNQLYKYYIEIVRNTDPDIFLMENVEGLLKYKDIIQNDFFEAGYLTTPFLLNTKDFGLPQNRKRVFFVGIKISHQKIKSELLNIFLENIIQNKSVRHNNIFDAIQDLVGLKAKTIRNATYLESKDWGYSFGEIKKYNSKYCQRINNGILTFPLLNHKTKYNNPRDIEIYNRLKVGDKSDAESIKDINPYSNRDHIFKDKFCKLDFEGISKTITAHMYYDCHMYIHPTEARGLTPREAARIQGFPDDYLFLGTPNEWYRQIGNAVSPPLGKIIGKGLNKMLDRIYEY